MDDVWIKQWTVKILYLGLRYTAAGGGTGTFQLTRRSSTSANGTYASPASVKMDTNNAAASCTIRAYTANPTPGTVVGPLIVTTLAPFISFTSSVNSPYPEYPLFNYQLAGQPIVLRGTSDGIALSCNGTSPNSTTTKLSLRVIFTEE